MSNSSARVPGWLWLIAGAILGALIMFLVRLSELEPTLNSLQLPTATKGAPTDAQPAARASVTTREGRNFAFYDMLRESEVPVTAKPAASTATKPDWDYYLQVASFQSAEDANDVRAQLILLNLKAHIEKSQSASGTYWHRIIVGPFANRSQMAKARSTLLSNRYEAMLLKRDRVQ